MPLLRRHRPDGRRRRIRKLRLLALLAVLFVLSGTAFAYGMVVAVNQQLSGLDPFRQALKQQFDGYIYAADGHTILAVLRGSQSRVLVQGDEISPWIKQAIVATEDRRFYQHRGVDIRGMARALLGGHPPQERRAGRLDDHAAVRQEPARSAPAGRSRGS